MPPAAATRSRASRGSSTERSPAGRYEESDDCIVPRKPRTKPSSIGGGDGGGKAVGRRKGASLRMSRTQSRNWHVTAAACPRIGNVRVTWPRRPITSDLRQEPGALAAHAGICAGCAGKTGKVLEVQVLCDEGVANHIGLRAVRWHPRGCRRSVGRGVRRLGYRAVKQMSSRVSTLSRYGEDNMAHRVSASGVPARRGPRPQACAYALCQGTGRSGGYPRPLGGLGSCWEAPRGRRQR